MNRNECFGHAWANAGLQLLGLFIYCAFFLQDVYDVGGPMGSAYFAVLLIMLYGGALVFALASLVAWLGSLIARLSSAVAITVIHIASPALSCAVLYVALRWLQSVFG